MYEQLNIFELIIYLPVFVLLIDLVGWCISGHCVVVLVVPSYRECPIWAKKQKRFDKSEKIGGTFCYTGIRFQILSSLLI